MGIRRIVSINKDTKNYLCELVNFEEESSKLNFQILGGANVRYCNIFKNDIIDIQVPLYENACQFRSRVIYIDKIDHYLVVEKPVKGIKLSKRRYKRIKVRFGVQITSGPKEIDESNCLFCSKPNAITVDLSVNGIGIYTSYKLDITDELTFNFTLPNGKELYGVKGIVRFKKDSEHDCITRYGIEFLKLSCKQAINIIDFITEILEEDRAYKEETI